MQIIYLDNAATTIPDSKATEQAMEFIQDKFYNPSAIYRQGIFVHTALDNAREGMLQFLDANRTHNFIFTSCGTESNNQVFQFAVKSNKNIVVNLGEHPSVYNIAKHFEQKGYEVRYAKLARSGAVDLEHLLSLVDDKTTLVSVMHINNETGAINDIDRIAHLVKDKTKNHRCYVHVDGVQAFAKITYNLSENIDFYTVSAHKIGGLKGVGGTYYKKNIPFTPFIYGGGQEMGLRSGTENVFGNIQFFYATSNRMANLKQCWQNVVDCKSNIQEYLEKELFKILYVQNSSPYILTISAVGLRGEVLLHMLEEEGVLCSTGSACSSNAKYKYSRIIQATGLKNPEIEGVLRLSFGYKTTLAECKQATEKLNSCAKKLKAKLL